MVHITTLALMSQLASCGMAFIDIEKAFRQKAIQCGFKVRDRYTPQSSQIQPSLIPISTPNTISVAEGGRNSVLSSVDGVCGVCGAMFSSMPSMPSGEGRKAHPPAVDLGLHPLLPARIPRPHEHGASHPRRRHVSPICRDDLNHSRMICTVTSRACVVFLVYGVRKEKPMSSHAMYCAIAACYNHCT